MISLKRRAHEEVAKYVRSGDIAVDLTAGNGFDTVFLARLVAPTGRVHAFDIQEAAIHATHRQVCEHGLESNVVLHLQSHASWSTFLNDEERSRVRAVMINLGYLPGSDSTIVTLPETTARALSVALECLAPGGLLSVVAYRGHPGGDLESLAVENVLSQLSISCYSTEKIPMEPAPAAPVLFLVFKR